LADDAGRRWNRPCQHPWEHTPQVTAGHHHSSPPVRPPPRATTAAATHHPGAGPGGELHTEQQPLPSGVWAWRGRGVGDVLHLPSFFHRCSPRTTITHVSFSSSSSSTASAQAESPCSLCFHALCISLPRPSALRQRQDMARCQECFGEHEESNAVTATATGGREYSYSTRPGGNGPTAAWASLSQGKIFPAKRRGDAPDSR
jgi:hypothetical protein